MHLVGLKELSELLEIPYEKLKVWKSRGRLPEPFQTISGTPVWDWDISEEDFRSIEKNENSGRPKKPKISIAGGLIEIDVQGSSKDKDENISIRLNGKSFVDIKAEPANSNNKSDRNLFIKVLGKKVIDQFWELKLVKEPSNIFKLDYNKINNLDGWGELSISNLKKSISNSKRIVLDKFIFSIGIRHIGQENAKILASFFSSLKEFLKFIDSNDKNKILKNLLELDGIGDTQTDSIKTFFSNKTNVKITKELINVLEISDFKSKTKNGILLNKKIMFTGGFKDMSRSEAKSIAENNGAKVLGSISKKLDILVVGDTKPTKKKIDQAKGFKIEIITEKQWNEILNS